MKKILTPEEIDKNLNDIFLAGCITGHGETEQKPPDFNKIRSEMFTHAAAIMEMLLPLALFWGKIREDLFDPGYNDPVFQEWAHEVGLLFQVAYDPKIHGEDIEADEGDLIYIDAPICAEINAMVKVLLGKEEGVKNERDAGTCCTGNASNG